MARNKYDIDETLSSEFNMSQFSRAIKYAAKYAVFLTFALIFAAASSAIGLIGPLLVKEVTDVYIPNHDSQGMITIALIYAGILVSTTVLNAVRSMLTVYAGQHIVADMRRDLFKHLQKLPFQYYDSRPHGKILIRVVIYVNSVSEFLTSGLVDFIVNLFTIAVIIIFMFTINAQLALVTVFGVPLIALVVGILKPKQQKAKRAYNNKSSNYHAYLNESIMGMRITQAFSREEFNQEIFDRIAKENKQTWMKRVRWQLLVPSCIDIISMSFICALYYVAALMLGNGTILLGTLLAMTRYTNRFWMPIVNIGDLYSQLAEIGAYLERIFETMNEPVDIQSLPGSQEYLMDGDVEFKNVTFAYEENKKVLKNVSFTVKRGENIALVGPTGSGKTTIVNLISRFYDITEGQILIDGKDIKDFTLPSLRSQMGIMLQDTFLFAGTIRENIRYGKLDATDEEILEASKSVKLDTYIDNLPAGYETEVSERGQSLSSGQRQLLSFARTLISKPKILILDEATSTIDTQTERLLQHGIKALMTGRTSFVIAHRLSTIKDCDRIMFIENGEIIESGSHDELLEQKGKYHSLFTSQLYDLDHITQTNG